MYLHLIGVVMGTVIGLGFGMLQELAWRRHQNLQQRGKLNSGWAVMPGSMRRVAYLLGALALVQILCPVLFETDCQWWVSGGVITGYGFMLLRQFQYRLSQQNR